MTYNFPANLYPENTTYTSHNSLFVFLDDKEKLEEFMKYFYKTLKKWKVKSEKGGRQFVKSVEG